MSAKFDNDWDDLVLVEFQKDYYLKLREFLIHEYSHKTIYPDKYKIFEALKLTSFSDTKVVVIGQDPYHGYNQAHGLAFSVQEGVAIPPSLQNIYKEISDDLGISIPTTGYLEQWAKQGVLLLNTCLTVQADVANSHRNKGWEIFTDKVIELLNQKDEPVVLMLWGNNAKSKKEIITNDKHLVLTAAHPSPLSAYRGFFGCRHFSKANLFLKKNDVEPINWEIKS